MNESKNLSPSEKMRAALPNTSRESRTRAFWSILTGVLATLMVFVCCACGILAWWFRPQIQENPELAQTLTRQIVDIEIPEVFQPHGTIEWNLAFVMQLKGVYYQRYVGDGVLTLLEVKTQLSNEDAIRQHIRKTLLEEASGGTELIVDHSKTYRESFEIAGQKVPFTFELARDGNEVFHLVEGVFNGKSGQVLLTLRVDDMHWKNDEDYASATPDQESSPVPIWVRKMIKSIGQPQADSATPLQTPQPTLPIVPVPEPAAESTPMPQ